MGPVVQIRSGITPGPIHNILRAETFAFRLANRPDFYIDNSTVVFYASDILAHGCHLSSWESRADGDLWSLIAAEIVTRPKDSVRVFKVKAHSSPEDAVDAVHQWLAAGNAAADKMAKTTLAVYTQESSFQTRVIQETTRIDHAFVCSKVLHRISLHLREKLKEEPSDEVRQNPPFVCNLTQENTREWQLEKLEYFNSPTWDDKWLQLVQHYFSLLKWPAMEEKLALIEIMLDLCI